MKGFKGKKLLTALGTIFAIVVMAFIACWASEKIVVNKNEEVLNGGAGMNYNIDTDLLCDDIIKGACELVDKNYNASGIGGGHGTKTSVWANDGTGLTGQIAISNLMDPSQFTAFDCTGMIYYVLTKLGCSTSGFSKNNPVPYDPDRWYYANPNESKLITKDTDLSLTYNGKKSKINIVKLNESITSTYRYYNTADGGFIPAGSIVISKAIKTNGLTKDYDHGWIYIGRLGNKDPKEIAKILVKEYGVDASYLINGDIDGEFTIKQYKNDKGDMKDCIQKIDDDCEHWRIECTSNSNRNGVYINNGDPDAQTNAGGDGVDKPTGTIYAFQLANITVTGKYSLSVNKYDSDYKAISVSNLNDVFSVKQKIDGNVSNKLTPVNNTSSGLVFGEFTVNQQNVSSVESFIIKEENPPKSGYETYNKEIEIQIKKEKINNEYKVSIDKVYIDGNLDEGTFLKEGNTTLKSYDNNNVRIDCLNNEIIVAIKNKKVDIALKKMIQVVSKKQEDGTYIDKEVITENGFNTDRSSGWNVDTTPLKNGETNALYTECKHPVQVNIGDKIKYDIRIYNEGEVAAKANVIKDYIPVGLKVLGVYVESDANMANNLIGKASGNRAEYQENDGVLTITLDEQPYIPAFGEILSNQIVWVVCEVQEDATGILTNVAEISEYKTENGVVLKDIDSTSDNWNNPNTVKHEDNVTTDKSTATWRNYANGKQSLVQNNTWSSEFLAQDGGNNGYKGDDDDFDKIDVLQSSKLIIKKEDNYSNSITDVPFTITKRVNSNVSTILNNEAGASFEFSDSFSSNTYEHIVYTITEGTNDSYVQAKNPMNIDLWIIDGKLEKYWFYAESEATEHYVDDSIHEYYIESTLGDVMLKVTVNFNKQDSEITLKIQNIPQTSNKYSVNIKKVSASDSSVVLNGVTFNYVQTQAKDFSGVKKTDANQESFNVAATVDGVTNLFTDKIIDKDNYNVIDKYTIKEINLGSSNVGYNTKLTKDFSLIVSKEYDKNNNEYRIDKIGLIEDGKEGIEVPKESIRINENGLIYIIKASLDEDTNTILIEVPNHPDNKIPFKLVKVDNETGNEINGTKFTIYAKSGDNFIQTWDGTQNGPIILDQSVDPGATQATFKIVERNAADGYDNLLAGYYILVDVKFDQEGAYLTEFSIKNQSDNLDNDDLREYVNIDLENGVVVVTIKNKETYKPVDLALKKVITEVNGVKVNNINGYGNTDRLTEGEDKSRIDTTPLDEGKDDALYYLNKTPVQVLNGSKIKYELRIYNEGTVDATASEIKDYVPAALRVLNVYYKGEPLTEGVDYTYSPSSPVLKISKLNNLIDAYVPAKGLEKGILSYDVIQVECEAFSADRSRVDTNIAEITEYKTEEGIIEADRDSEPDNLQNPGSKSNNEEPILLDTLWPEWQEYAGDRENVIEDGKFKNYPGQQDDDDFEKIIVYDVDLALKKIITKVGDTDINSVDPDGKYNRFQDGVIKTSTEHLDWGESTTAEYFLNKTPVQVRVNEYITYQIRIYNEGDIDATAKSIKDYIPKGLTFDSVYYGDEQLTTTDYSIENNVLTINILDRKNLIPSYKLDGEISYDSVFVKCKVTGETRGLLTNVAEITKYKTKYGETDVDRDSQTNKVGGWKAPEGSNKLTLEGKSGDAWANYYESSSYNIGAFLNYRGQQDDDDFEKIFIINSYNIRLEKVDEQNSGISGSKFTINGTEYVTNDDGNTAKTDWAELNDVHSLDTYTITEIETKEGYAKLGNPIFFAVAKKVTSNGTVDLDGYYINFVDQKVDGSAFIRYNTNTKMMNFTISDELGRAVDIIVEVEKSEEIFGNYEIKIKIENKLKDSLYQLYINKIDSFGKNIEGVKFVVNANLSDQEFENKITTNNTSTYITTSKILASYSDIVDVYEIEEIETFDKYIKLPSPLRLEVIKGLTEDKKEVKVKCMMLYYGNNKVSVGTESAVVKDIPVGTNGQKIDISAEIREITSETGNKAQGIYISIPNEPVLQFYGLRIKKVNKYTGEALEGATFNYSPEGIEELYETEETDSTGLTTLLQYEVITSAGTTTYTITEGQIPQNYLPYEGNIKLNVVTKLEDGVYVLDKDKTNVEGKDVKLDITNGIITLTVPDEPTGAYSINIKKVSKEDGTPLAGAKFAIKEASSKEKATETQATDNSGIVNLLNSVKMNSERTDSYIITEIAVPEKYKLYDGEIKLDIVVKLVNGQYVIDTANTKVNGQNASLDIKGSIITVTVSDPEKEFDLALRKFISKVNGEELTGEESREPDVDLGILINGDPAKNREKTATYTHKKEPKLVCPTDVVEYTLRVYNEGELDGYARQIIDDVPIGVQMVAPMYDEDGKPANLNAQYRWVMYKEMKNSDTAETEKVAYAVNDVIRYNDKYYVPTLNADEATIIVTDFLSKEVGEQNLEEGKLNPNLLYAFNFKTLDYADIKVEFIVRPSKDDKTIITNYAQISEHQYKDGTPIIDRDSTPNVWKEGEDDQDVEHLKVKWFDLALYKWVTTTIVTEDGKTKEYPTEHTQDYKDKLVNVTVQKEKLNKTVVKFKYIIKVENQGTLPGYAKELRDHIPDGLKFFEEDNTEYRWKLQEDGTITTDYIKDRLLNPQEAELIPVVLTWINGENNLGLKVNYAEISEDYNEYGDTTDIDSTPDNFKDIPVEDEEDGDEVMLNIRTGSGLIAKYTAIGLGIFVILSIGIILVKRNVLYKEF